MIFNPFATSNVHQSLYGATFCLASKSIGSDSCYTVYRAHSKVTSNRVHYMLSLSTPSLPGVLARARKLMLAVVTHVYWLSVYIYLAKAKEVAQSCAVCHRFTLISPRYSVVIPSLPSQWQRSVKRSPASRAIDESYLSISLRPSSTWRSQTGEESSIFPDDCEYR